MFTERECSITECKRVEVKIYSTLQIVSKLNKLYLEM